MACATHMIHAHCGDREARPASWTRDAAGGNVTERADSIEVALNAAPGCRIVETPVTVLASGQPLVLTTHVLRGAGSGRTVGIVSGLHGDEFSTAELVLSLLPLLPPVDIADRCSGADGQPPTFETGTRSTTLDMANLNRVFPGSSSGTVTEMLAHTLIQDVLAVCDVIIDLHSEPDTMGIRCVYSPAPSDDYGRQAFALAQASGCPIVFVTDGVPGMLTTAARARDIIASCPRQAGRCQDHTGCCQRLRKKFSMCYGQLGRFPANRPRRIRSWLTPSPTSAHRSEGSSARSSDLMASAVSSLEAICWGRSHLRSPARRWRRSGRHLSSPG